MIPFSWSLEYLFFVPLGYNVITKYPYNQVLICKYVHQNMLYLYGIFVGNVLDILLLLSNY